MGAAKKAYGDSFGAFLTSMSGRAPESSRSMSPDAGSAPAPAAAPVLASGPAPALLNGRVPSGALGKLVGILAREKEVAIAPLLEKSGLEWSSFAEALRALVSADMVRLVWSERGETATLTERGLLLQAAVEDLVNSRL